MNQVFESMITSYILNKVGISDQFVNTTLSAHLKNRLLYLYLGNDMKTADKRNEIIILKDTTRRSDKIYWLDPKNKNIYEDEFVKLMDEFVSYLNETCYTGITGYEFHYSFYEKVSFYGRHLDTFKNNDSRQYSMITYLNTDWQPVDGGELSIHHVNGLTQQISPTSCKSVFFRSTELEHEIMVTNVPRLAITGWLKR